MKKILGLTLFAGMLLTLPNIATAHDGRVCRDEDGDRVPCRTSYRVCRDEDGDRVPCGRQYYARPTYYYGDRPRAYRYYRSPGVSIGIGPYGFYGRGW